MRINHLDKRVKAMLITGTYIPPPVAKKLRVEQTTTVSDSNRLPSWGGVRAGRLLRGDLFFHCWMSRFPESLGGTGAWKLSDPGLPTSHSGRFLDRISFCPGSEMSTESFFGGEGGETDDKVDLVYSKVRFPAGAFPIKQIGDRHPLVLSLPNIALAHFPHATLYKFDGITPEQREREMRG